jgi:hypothetical protein
MGKRELLIVAVFVIIGAGAYYLTAPPAQPGTARFSLATLSERWRAGRGARVQGRAMTSGTVVVSPSVSELTIAGVSTVVLTGEPRTDIAWTLEVESSGADDASAQRAAEAIVLRHDEMSQVLAITVRAPRAGTQATTLRLHVPARLVARIDGARRVTAADVVSLRLDNMMGDATITDVTGAVTGTHRNGNLTVARVGSLSMTLVGSTAAIGSVHGETAINARNGAYHLLDGGGPTTIDATNAVIDVTAPMASTRVAVTGGALSVVHPRADVRVDARATTVRITLDQPVPVTAIVTAGMRLELDGDLPITLDAIADGGTIVANDFGLTPELSERGAVLHHVFGARGHVALKTDGGEIVIARRK